MQFPEERSRYLDETQNVVGFHDRNVRQLWLALALLTEGYQETNKGKFKSELQGYTSPDFSFEVRKIAFEFIGELNLFSGPVLKNLVNAATHPNWRFRTFARELLAELLEDVDIKSAIYSDFDHFSEAEKAYLNRINTDR
ncbi:MAG: hypothetical protein CMC08_07405 [Flavobacteriaceae bacterium]|nr:hypothetical protein [Flavobacteriaceae bacterium]